MKIGTVLKKVLVALLFSAPVFSWAGIYEADVVTKTAQGADFTQVIDLANPVLRRVSMQATWADGTPGGLNSFNTGTRSTGAITVSNFASLAAANAQVIITISSNAASALTGAVLDINGAKFREGIEWAVGASTLATAQSLSNAINAHAGLRSTHTLTAQAIIYASASVTGSYYNSYSVTSSTPTALLLSASTLTGGQDNATIQFPSLGVTLTQGTEWNAVTSNAITAENIENAIGANSTLTALFTSTHPTGASIVYSSVTLNGQIFIPISVSSRTALTLSNGVGLTGGTHGLINIVNDTITGVSTNTYPTGLKVLYSTTTGPIIGGLIPQTTYFVIHQDDTHMKLATSAANAIAGTAIDLLSMTTSSNSVHNLTPLSLSLASNTGFLWQASNDGVSYSTFTYQSTTTAISSVTLSASNLSGTQLWDFGEIGYRYLRFLFTAPTNGGIALRVRQYGKDNQ